MKEALVAALAFCGCGQDTAGIGDTSPVEQTTYHADRHTVPTASVGGIDFFAHNGAPVDVQLYIATLAAATRSAASLGLDALVDFDTRFEAMGVTIEVWREDEYVARYGSPASRYKWGTPKIWLVHRPGQSRAMQAKALVHELIHLTGCLDRGESALPHLAHDYPDLFITDWATARGTLEGHVYYSLLRNANYRRSQRSLE